MIFFQISILKASVNYQHIYTASSRHINQAAFFRSQDIIVSRSHPRPNRQAAAKSVDSW